MGGSENHPSEFKKSLLEGMSMLSRWIVSQLASLAISPLVGMALSIIFVSVFALMKFKRAFDIRRVQNFYEYVENKVIELELEIRKVEESISLLQDALKSVREEHRKISFEEQLRAETANLKQLVDIKLYYESLLGALRVVESQRHVYGDKVDEMLSKIVDLAIKASEGKVDDKGLKELVERFGNMIDNVPDFPSILLEVVDEKLGQTRA